MRCLSDGASWMVAEILTDALTSRRGCFGMNISEEDVLCLLCVSSSVPDELVRVSWNWTETDLTISRRLNVMIPTYFRVR